MLGGAIGSSFDTIPGRKVGEMSSPRAQEGEPIPLVFGSARVTGRLMSCGEPDIRTESEGGKGGPKVENETAYLSYSILVCESSELRDSSIGGILMVIENNKIVYDVRPNPAISAADSAKWKANKVFYFGGEVQGVDPTEQMIHGAGNVPAYRGLCRMVVTDEDVTQHGGSIPTYEFVTSQCGTSDSPVGADDPRWLGTGFIPAGHPASCRPLSFAGEWLGADDTVVEPTTSSSLGDIHRFGDYMVAFPTEEGHSPLPVRISPISDLGTWTSGATQPVYAVACAVSGSRLFAFRNQGGLSDTLHYLDSATDSAFTTGHTFTAGFTSNYPFSLAGNGTQVVVCNDYGQLWGSNSNGDTGTFTLGVLLFYPDRFYTTRAAMDCNNTRFIIGGRDDYSGAAYYTDDVGASATRCSFPSGAPASDAATQVKHCGNGNWLIAFEASSPTPVNGGLYLSTDNGQNFNEVALPVQMYFSHQSHQSIAVDANSGRVVIMGTEYGTNATRCFYTDDFDTWVEIDRTGTDVFGISEIYPLGASSAFVPPEGSIELPDSPGYYIDPDTGEISGPTATVDTCPPITLQEIIDKLDARAGIPTANSVTTELDGIEVPGYAIDTFVTVAEAKEPLRQVWFFDCPEWDDAIRYRLRGQATDFTIDPDDLIEGEDATEQGTRGQTVEYPKRLHVQYVDPVTGYKPMKQTAERISPDIRVKGELVTGANITLEADTAKQAADIGLKTAWTEREDSREFAIPVDYWPQAIAAHTFTLEGRRYRITELRLEAGAIYIKSVYDRISAYSSAATGTVGPAPVGQSNLRGPTVSAVMNLPVLRDADDKAGIYWAASGLLDTWQGAQLQLNRGAWENGPQATTSATMGELTASLPTASRYGMDSTNTLSVRLTPTSGALDSVTYDDLIAEANAAAILYADGTAEIIQFQTATETAPREYELTGLLRGRQDTTPGTHAIGATFVLLNEAVRFVAIRPDDLGQTLTFRAVSLGTSADSNATQAITLTTIESLREWQPYSVVVTADGLGGYCVEWIGRGRLGSSVMPVHSLNFRDYAGTFTEGADTLTATTTDQSLCRTQAELEAVLGVGFSTPTVAVIAKSRIHTSFDSPAGTP